MTQALTSLFPALIGEIRRQLPDVLAIYLFGSQAEGSQRPDSDLDLAVLPATVLEAETLFALKNRLENLARRDVDLVDLRRASTVMRSQVISTGERIYCAEAAACDCFEDTAYSSYARLNEERRQILADIQTRGRIHG